MDRIDRKKIIAVSKQEALELSDEFIKMFCQVNSETAFDCYLMKHIREEYPKITTLYHAIVEP